MHKKLYALLFFFMFPFMAYADVPIDEAHFPDPAFRSFISLNLDNGWFDTNGDFKGFEDGILSDSEISKIERIESGGFKSLKGIKYFYAIKELGLNSYEIEVDVSGLTALEILHVAQPTKLNASGCTALKELRCDARYLTKLDISGCTALETLRCDVSAKGLLTELDVSSCTALKYLWCNGNKLTSLDLRNNPALEYLSCGGNELTSLDLRGNYVLKELYCGYNRLTDLDLSNNPSLEILNFESNCLTELDVSNNTALRSIGCLDQTRRTLNFSKTSEGYEVCLKDYVSHLENIDVDSVGASDNKLLSYDKQAGVAVFGLPVTKLRYNYNLHFKNINSVENVCMPVTITNPLIITAIGRSKSGLITNTIICNIADDSYLDLRGEPITEYSINPYVYDYRDCENTGFAADGNSRLILTVLADKPGIAYFSFDDSIGAKLESLARTELSAQDQLSTTRMSYGNQVSVVLVAPESFPKLKYFPSDTFNVHVKFINEDGEVIEDNLELKIETTPVLCIPGMFYSAVTTFGILQNSGVWRRLLDEKFDQSHIYLWDYDATMNHDVLLFASDNSLFNKLTSIFNEYAQEGIVCTKADIVSHGMGGLLVRRYLQNAGKAARDVNNWSVSSYKQGMVRRLITIAVPHRGTPWADRQDTSNFLTDNYQLALSTIQDEHPYAENTMKSIAYLMTVAASGATSEEDRKKREQDIWEKYKNAWLELRTDAPREYGFPSKVPMYSIYGDITAGGIADFLWTVGSVLFNKASNGYNIDVRDLPVYFTSNIRNFIEKEIHGAGKIKLVGKALSVIAFVLEAPSLIPSLARVTADLKATSLFGPEHNDLIVSVTSAAGDFNGASSCYGNTFVDGFFTVSPDRYAHWSICRQNDVGEEVASLLKGSASRFKTFSGASNTYSVFNAANVGASSTEDDSFNFRFAQSLSMTVEPSVLAVSQNASQTVSFTVTAGQKMTEDVYCIFGNDNGYRFFKMPSSDGNRTKFEAEFNAEEIFTGMAGSAIEILCMSCISGDDGISGMYISNTVNIAYLADLNSVDILGLNFAGKVITYTNEGLEIPAGLYVVADDGRYYDVSSPLVGTEWTSTEFARVNENGCIYGLNKGSTTLTATFMGFSASIDVVVLPFESSDMEESPQIITQTLPNARKGVSYRVVLGATGGGIIWSAKGLPAGLNIINGEITGIPEGYGTFNVEITASNSTGSVSAMFTLIVQASETATVIDQYHFRDANLRQLILENFDTDGDGVLSIEEIDNVHSLEVNGKGITSLEGLEIFTNIEYIDCSYNNLTSLDVSPFLALKWLVCTNNSLTLLDLSENKLLINLDCTGNFIHKLDVSDNVELEELYCWSNDIHTLILGDNPKLTVIHCHDNPLGELDVTGCSGLLRLYCWNCGLETIDLSKCEQLISLDIAVNRIESLDVSNNRLMKSLCVNENPLKSIDLSNNTALVDLLLWSTDLEALDLRNCPNLELLHCHDSNLITLTVGSHPNLRELNCNNNQITLLNVSGCPALEILYCYDNEITSMVMGNNTALRDFHCDNNQISLLDVSNCPSLEYLYCPDNKITLLTMGSHAKLRELACVNNQIKVLDVSGCSALEVLACINNQLTSLDVSVCKKLERLYCNNNYIEVLNLVENTELVTLDCSVNNLVSLNIDNCGKLLWLYCNDNSLTRLNIGGCPEFVEFVHDEFTEIVNHHSTDGDNSGESSDEDTPVKSDDQAPIVIDAPAVDLQNPTVKETIINALQAQNPTLNFTIGNDVEILMLPEKFTGIERTIDDVSSEELAAIPESEDVAVVFPVIVVEQDGVYIWGVQLDNLKVGTLINLYLLRKDSTTVSSAFQTSGYAQDTYIFLDDDGIEINTVPANKHVNIVAFMEAGKTYAPILTQSGLVSDTPDASPDTEPDTPSIEPKNNAIGSSGGGCSAVGFSVFVAIAFLLRKKM